MVHLAASQDGRFVEEVYVAFVVEVSLKLPLPNLNDIASLNWDKRFISQLKLARLYHDFSRSALSLSEISCVQWSCLEEFSRV
jgi:hypothetical protein